MIFIPKYTVSYKGVFYKAGKQIEIDAADRKEMEKHGKILEETTAKENANIEETAVVFAAPAKRSGRPRKAVNA